MEKEYFCICGQKFNKSQLFNSHKGYCEIHLKSVGKYDKVKKILHETGVKNGLRSGEISHQKAIEKQSKELLIWLSEKHTCEKCGKVMVEKYGSGRFCSRSCANTRKHSSETKEKISNKMKGNHNYIYNTNAYNNEKKAISKESYLNNPKYCNFCNKPLDYDKRYRSTCSYECRCNLISLQMKDKINKHGGNLNKDNRSYKYGCYKGIQCDSSYELAYLVYNLEHNIDIKRNTSGFDYIYEGEHHLYYPDFIVDGVYIEIKNYETNLVKEKAKQFPCNLKILYFNDLKEEINYCKNKYGSKYWDILYDK